MLQIIKKYISNLPEADFGTFYQQFILQFEDKLLENDTKVASMNISSSRDILKASSNIDKIVKELNTWQ